VVEQLQHLTGAGDGGVFLAGRRAGAVEACVVAGEAVGEAALA
jgi:hypothetical protein